MLLATCAPVPDQVVVAIVLSNLALIESLSPWAVSLHYLTKMHALMNGHHVPSSSVG